MKRLLMKALPAALLATLAAGPALAGHVLDFRVLGLGSVVNDCDLAASVGTGCNVVISGQASGTHIGHDDFELNFRLTNASQRLSNGVGGVCVVVTGIGVLNPPSTGASISFNVAGTICEEGGMSTPAHFDGSYRITGGAARFDDAAGGGRLTATWLRGPGGTAFMHLHGTIQR